MYKICLNLMWPGFCLLLVTVLGFHSKDVAKRSEARVNVADLLEELAETEDSLRAQEIARLILFERTRQGNALTSILRKLPDDVPGGVEVYRSAAEIAGTLNLEGSSSALIVNMDEMRPKSGSMTVPAPRYFQAISKVSSPEDIIGTVAATPEWDLSDFAIGYLAMYAFQDVKSSDRDLVITKALRVQQMQKYPKQRRRLERLIRAMKAFDERPVFFDY